jgi:tetratricopeptide (TPR) repeat protein
MPSRIFPPRSRVFWLRNLLALIVLAAPAFTQQPAKTSDPEPVEQHFHAAETFQLAGDLSRAADEYRAAISLGLQRLGNIRTSEGNYGEATQLLTIAISTDSKNTDAAIDLAVAHFYAGELAKARSYITPVLEHEPSNFRALNLAGKIDFTQGNFQSAVDRLQAALAVKSDFDVAYSLALADLQLKKFPQAMVLFDEMKGSMKPSPELHVLIGRAYRMSGYPEQAVGEFKKAIALDPNYPHAHSLLGLAYLQQGEKAYVEARQQFESELAIDPQDYVSRYYLGVVQFNQHDLAAADATLERVTRQHPDSADAYFYLGQVYLQERRLEPAVAALRKAIALSTGPGRDPVQLSKAHSLLAEALQKQGKADEAAAELANAERLKTAKLPSVAATPSASTPGSEQTVALGSDQQELRKMMAPAPGKNAVEKVRESAYIKSVAKLVGEAYHNLGVIDARASRYTNAADEFAEAEHWNTDIEALDRNWSLAAFRAERYEQAISPLQRQLDRTPQDAAIRQMLGLSYYMTDQFAKSAETFRPILNKLPDNPGLLYAAGISLVRSGDSAAASRLFRQMLEHGSNVPEVHLMVGQAYYQQSQYPEALQELGRALQMNSQLTDAHYYSGMVYFKQGKFDDAAREFNFELSLNSASIPAQYQLAYVRLQQRQPDEAIRLLTDVVAQKPSYGDAHYQLGKALLEKGEVNPAIEHLEISTRLQPNESYGYYQLSLAYRRAGRAPDAARALGAYQELKDKESRKPSASSQTK